MTHLDAHLKLVRSFINQDRPTPLEWAHKVRFDDLTHYLCGETYTTEDDDGDSASIGTEYYLFEGEVYALDHDLHFGTPRRRIALVLEELENLFFHPSYEEEAP